MTPSPIILKTYAQERDWAWLAGVAELRDITWVDLPTSHWPMWSRPRELAQLIGNVAENTQRSGRSPQSSQRRTI